jgi:hypothetical protein
MANTHNNGWIDSEETVLERHIASIQRYVEHGIEPGSGIRAILSNDLMETFARLDDDSRAALYDIVKYLVNKVPCGLWGSPERVQNHINAKRKELAAGGGSHALRTRGTIPV